LARVTGSRAATSTSCMPTRSGGRMECGHGGLLQSAASVRALSRADAASFYYVTHIQEANVRTYLNDPAARPKEEERLEKTAAEVRPYGCMAYSLGDENGILSSPTDMKPAELEAFRGYLPRCTTATWRRSTATGGPPTATSTRRRRRWRTSARWSRRGAMT